MTYSERDGQALFFYKVFLLVSVERVPTHNQGEMVVCAS
jgi:hypothetical protein